MEVDRRPSIPVYSPAEQYLGHPFMSVGAPMTPERNAILATVNNHVEEMRDSMAVAVRSLGVDVSAEQLAAWQPEESQVAKLQGELAGERRRARMLDSFGAYLRDETRMGKFRACQVDALHALGGFLEHTPRELDNSKRGFVDMATGTGKTGVITGFVEGLKYDEDPDDPPYIVVLSPTQQITKQTVGLPQSERDEPKGFAKFTPHLEPTSYYQFDHRISPLTVMTNSSFNNLMKQAMMPEVDVIIIDETHTALGEQISEFIRLIAPNKLVIGFTATPDFSSDKTTDSLLRNRIHSLPLREAVRDGILAPFEAEVRDLQVKVPSRQDTGMEAAEYRMAVEKAKFMARLEDAAPDVVAAVKRGDGVLIRCPAGDDVWFARQAAEMFRETGAIGPNMPPYPLRALALGGKGQSFTERQAFVELFNRGRIQIFSYVKSINMGTDVPGAKLLVNLAPTSGIVDMTQAVGRVGRRVEGKNGPKKARCIDYRDTSLGEAQHTAIDVLNNRPPGMASAEELEFGEGGGPQVTLTGVADLDFFAESGTTDRYELGEAERAVMERTWSLEQAAAYFDIGTEYMAEYLERVGHEGTTLTRNELTVLEELCPELVIPPANAGHMHIEKLKSRIGTTKPIENFIADLTSSGIDTVRMRNDKGVVETYVPLPLIPAHWLQ